MQRETQLNAECKGHNLNPKNPKTIQILPELGMTCESLTFREEEKEEEEEEFNQLQPAYRTHHLCQS